MFALRRTARCGIRPVCSRRLNRSVLLAINVSSFHTSHPSMSSKEARQGRVVKKLLALGIDYQGTLSDAKQTLNLFMRHDAKLLGVSEIGNGNNRNLSDRLIPRLMEECQKQNLPVHGDYIALRNRLKESLFSNAITYDDPGNVLREKPLEPVSASAGGKKKKPAKAKKTKVDLI